MQGLLKVKTGIAGLDEITNGGLPAGRTTLVCGGPGCGKSLLSAEFIVRGAEQFNEPGVLMTFEEKTDELVKNFVTLGFDLSNLQKNKKVRLDYVHIDAKEIEETGEYDLEGLFIRLQYAIETIGAKRVVLDTIENLFAGLTNQGILRAELRRLFDWLKEKKVTTIVTAEKGEGSLTRHGLEEYVSDCVILLDHRMINQVSTRRLRIIKYRGSLHGTNEYPFLIDEDGLSVLPITSLLLNKEASSQKISSGITSLDKMFSGKGFFSGSIVLVSGTAGTGKTSIAASFVDAACKRKERCIYFAIEESPRQIMRNMNSIGLDLEKHVRSGYLKFNASRPTLFGLEMHLVTICKIVNDFKPKIVVLDPVSNLTTGADMGEVKAMLTRLIDFLQTKGVTAMFPAQSSSSPLIAAMDDYVSSLVDTWLTIKDIVQNGERCLAMHIIKSRGLKHSNRVMRFRITDNGLTFSEDNWSMNGIGNDGKAWVDQPLIRKSKTVAKTKT